MDHSIEAYGGSRLLLPVANKIGVPIDQTNFVFCQIAAILLGFPYRLLATPETVGPFNRHVLQVVFGAVLAWFCYGQEVGYLLLQSMLCYVLMVTTNGSVMAKLVLVVSLGYLCFSHIWRLIYDFGGYTLNISGPLMINTQRLSCLAFALWDGQRSDKDKLPESLRKRSIEKRPNIIEFLSYVFSFHAIGCGPMCFYDDYLSFINGTNYERKAVDSVNHATANGVLKTSPNTPPSPYKAMFTKLIAVVIFGVLTTVLSAIFPPSLLSSERFHSQSFAVKILFTFAVTASSRTKYYFAWKLAEVVNISAGLGFSGYDEHGEPRFDLLENADAVKVETATSLKGVLDNWNKTTTSWLRYIIYDRIHSTLAVFIMSAFWHGFYAGYYITFINGAIVTPVARMVRRTIRPKFQGSRQMALLYDVITFACTLVMVAYITAPFVMLELWMAVDLYKSLYFSVYIMIAVFAAVSMVIPPPKSSRKDAKTAGTKDMQGHMDGVKVADNGVKVAGGDKKED